MSNYLDNLDVIDANNQVSNVLFQDRGTLALANANSLKIGDLNNLRASDKTSLVNAINSVMSKDCVNVKDFGAVGNARYYDVDRRSYWADSNYTVAPHDDTDAVNAAIAYADANDICTVYFPEGYYYLPNWTYTLDISKRRFVGDGATALVSSGLTSGSFITINSPLLLDMYNTSKCPLFNISLWGCYGLGSDIHVNGLTIDIPERVVACHSSFINVGIKDFYNGLNSIQGYKTIFYNLSCIACQTGISLAATSAIPQYFIGGFVECCGLGLFNIGGGWCQAIFNDFAFEYNINQIAIANGNHFYGCRFEDDPLCITSNYIFAINGTNNSFDNCDFLLLPNFSANARFWVKDPESYVGSSLNGPLIAGTGEVCFTKCNIALDDITVGEGFYLVSLSVQCINSKFSAPQSLSARIIDSNNYVPFHDEFTS